MNVNNSPRKFSRKNHVLIQPKDAAKPKFRLPPKEEVKTESFQGIQLKPVTKDPKQPQQAQTANGVELKVAPLKGINDLATISMLLYLYVSLNFLSKLRYNSALLNSAQIYL